MRIRELRLAAGMKQAELARRMGVGKDVVCRWDNGRRRPRAEKLPKLAAVLGCTIEELYQPTEREGRTRP